MPFRIYDSGLGPIPGITASVLWNTWKTVRQELRNSSIRDVVDFLEYDVDPQKWIGVLLRQISSGRYEASNPVRFMLGKGSGFSRVMTLPAIPDLVLYRAIVDFLYRRVRRGEKKHAYFRRRFLHQAQQVAQQAAQQVIRTAAAYKMSSRSSFLNWLRYDQYRKHLLVGRIYPYFVITDISNFFDSVLHSHVEEALRGLAVPPRMTGLLFYLLERLSIRQDYASSHGISLPVDEFDCSRTLAHIILFPHDEAIVGLVGEDAYVRWMDDQNIGVSSRAEGLRVLATVGKSLARLHLTPNTKKSRILSLSEARRHFHLDINRLLDDADLVLKQNISTRRKKIVLRRLAQQIWARARAHDGKGEFGKVLKRLYHLAAAAEARFLRRRALSDLLNDPTMAERICEYMRSSGTPLEYLRFIDQVMESDEQVYADVNVAIVESLLRFEPGAYEQTKIRELASNILRNRVLRAANAECKAVAPLLLLRFGDRRSIPLLRRLLVVEDVVASQPVARSVALVLASYGRSEFQHVRRVASRLLRNHLASVVLLIERIRAYPEVPVRYKNRLRQRFDSITTKEYLDMRGILTARLLALSPSARVTQWVDQWKQEMSAKNISAFDRRLLTRLVP